MIEISDHWRGRSPRKRQMSGIEANARAKDEKLELRLSTDLAADMAVFLSHKVSLARDGAWLNGLGNHCRAGNTAQIECSILLP